MFISIIIEAEGLENLPACTAFRAGIQLFSHVRWDLEGFIRIAVHVLKVRVKISNLQTVTESELHQESHDDVRTRKFFGLLPCLYCT